jgi:hypothetical protein
MAADRETQSKRKIARQAPFDQKWGAKRGSVGALIVALTLQTAIERSRHGIKHRQKRSPNMGRQTRA